jgi:hypothetical protein
VSQLEFGGVMDSTSNKSRTLPMIIVGAFDHPDFREVMALLRTTARYEIGANESPEIVLVAQARPGQIGQNEIASLQRRWPLAGIVAVLGSWCEGETRTGRPWPGVRRLYLYEFPAWWQQQLALRHADLCPEWARPTTDVYRTLPPQRKSSLPAVAGNRQRGLVRLSTASRDTAEALAVTLDDAGYATVWSPPSQSRTIVHGATAGIWDGGQLDEREALDLAAFCRLLARDAAPIVVLLNFPRRDRCEIAKELGVASVLGKPWINDDLVATVDAVIVRNARALKQSGLAA